MAGIVYLIGIGPGDPGLLGKKAEKIISAADIILYDALVDQDVLGLARVDAERIFVGKRGGRPSPKQAEINRLLVEKARQGKTIARVKGGDPFVLGRGAEEALYLSRNRVAFEVIPGITSAIAAPTYAGIPLTHRDFASCFTVVTGQEDPAKMSSGINWNALANGKGTLVFLMGISRLEDIVRNLIRSGLASRTPVGIVENGTYPRQRTVVGTLGTIVARARKERIKPPAAIVVGEVVRVRDRLNWFERKPLFGKRIVITRTRDQASALAEVLCAAGGEIVEFPTIEVVAPSRTGKLDEALKNISQYDWLVFTSPNGVRGFMGRIFDIGMDVRSLGGVRIAVVGPATADTLFHYGVRADRMPRGYYTDQIPRAIGLRNIRGARLLLARSDISDPGLSRALHRAGGTVEEVICYRTRKPRRLNPEVKALVARGDFDGITFTSSSTVKNFFSIFGEEKARRILRKKGVFSIGMVTSRTLGRYRIRGNIQARQPTVPRLAETVIRHFSRSKGGSR